jgi:predicted MFS family arabinose efflux permease
VIQLAITLGASAGGLLFDRSGYGATFAASAAILVCSALVALIASRKAIGSRASHRRVPSVPGA